MKSKLMAALAALSPVALFAEGEGQITIDETLGSIDFTSAVTGIGEKLGPAVISILGLVAGIWVVQIMWRNIKAIGSK